MDDYFEFAKELMIAQGQAAIEKIKANPPIIKMTQCIHCGFFFPAGCNANGPICMCSDDCAEMYEAEELAWED